MFDESLDMYTAKVNGVTVAYADEDSANDLDRANTVASLYYKRLDEIIAFMMPYLREMYGEIDTKTVKENLGTPIIYPNACVIEYFEHSLDYEHIFTLEFSSPDFTGFKYFSVDG